MSPRPFAAAVVLAGGRGDRMGAGVPKQFLELSGKPMLSYSLDLFESSPAISSIVLVVTDPTVDLPGPTYEKLYAVVRGGAARQDSVAQGLANLPPETELVLVHDAARPLLEEHLIEELIGGLDDQVDGAIPGIPLEDAVKIVADDGLVEREVDRSAIWRVQTPQVFRRAPLEKALAEAQAAGLDSADCSQMLTRAGYRVRVVTGDPFNLKVTRQADLRLARLILKSRS